MSRSKRLEKQRSASESGSQSPSLSGIGSSKADSDSRLRYRFRCRCRRLMFFKPRKELDAKGRTHWISIPIDSRICRTFAASPAEPGSPNVLGGLSQNRLRPCSRSRKTHSPAPKGRRSRAQGGRGRDSPALEFRGLGQNVGSALQGLIPQPSRPGVSPRALLLRAFSAGICFLLA